MASTACVSLSGCGASASTSSHMTQALSGDRRSWLREDKNASVARPAGPPGGPRIRLSIGGGLARGDCFQQPDPIATAVAARGGAQLELGHSQRAVAAPQGHAARAARCEVTLERGDVRRLDKDRKGVEAVAGGFGDAVAR